MKRLTILLTIAFTISIASITSVTAVNTNDWDDKVTWAGPQANQPSYWVNQFENLGYQNVTCTKYGSSHSGWLPGQYEIGVIKAGQWNYIYYQPDNTGRYLEGERQELSHIFKCNAHQPPPPPKWDPDFGLRMCADPRMLLRITNNGDYPIQFRISTRKGNGTGINIGYRIVKPGESKRILRWVIGQSYMRLVARPAPGLFFLPIYAIPDKEVLYAKKLPKSKPWGSNGCPASLKAAQRWASR